MDSQSEGQSGTGDLRSRALTLMEQTDQMPVNEEPGLAGRYLEAVMQAADIAVILMDLDGVITNWNRAAEGIFGYPVEEAIGRQAGQLIVPDDQLAVFERTIREVQAGGAVAEIAVVGRRRDRRLVELVGGISPVVDGEGRLIARAAMVRDVSEQNRLRRELREMALIVETSSEAMINLEPDGRIRSWNSGAEQMYGFSADEVVGRSISTVVPEGYRQELARLLSQAREGYRIDQYETVRKRRDGSLLDVSLTFSPVFDERGGVVAVSVVGRDVTQKRRYSQHLEVINRDLRERTEALERANKDLETFSHSVSHDLRAPLRSIDGFGQALLEDYYELLDDSGRDYVRRIREATAHMRRLIEALLRLSRISRVELQRLPTDLTDLCRRIADRLREHEPQRVVECAIAESVTSNCDRQLIEVALENLIGNAWKFTAERDAARIEFGVTMRDGRTVYYVQDNGAGFDPTYVDKAFLIFHRLHADDRFPGLGIGLPLVKRVVERHGGEVWAESLENQGATFCFTLGEDKPSSTSEEEMV